MADPRLRLRQIAAPDFSAANRLLIASGESFQDAFDPFQDALQRYGKGQKERGDAQAAALIAGVRNEDDFNKLLESGELQRLNTSAAGTKMIEDARAGALDLMGERQRQTVVGDTNTRAWNADSRAAAAESRRAQTFQTEQERQAWLRQNALDFVAAEQKAYAQGAGVGRPDRSQVQAQVYQGLIDRGMPPHIAEGFMMNFQDESAFRVDVTEAEPNVHGTRGKGLYQLTGARRDQFERKYGNDYSIDNQLDFLMEELKTTEKGAWDIIQRSQSAGEAGANIVNNFLRPAAEHARARTAKYVSKNGWSGPKGGGAAATGADGSPTPSTGSIATTRGGEAFAAKMAESGLFTPNEVMSQVSGLREAYGDGEAEARAAEAEALEQQAKETNDILAGLVAKTTLNPENETPEQAVDEAVGILSEQGYLSDAEAVQMRQRGLEMIEAGGYDSNFQQVQPDLQFQADVETAVGAEQARLAQDPSSSVRADIERYSEDPVQALIGDLGGDSAQEDDPRFKWFGDERNLELNEVGARNRMNEVAEELGVPPEIAGILMREVYNPDPTGRNTLEKRFPIEEMKELLPDFDLNAISDNISDQAQLGRMEGELNRLATERQRVATQLSRARNPREEARYREELAKLDARLLVIQGQGANRPPE